MLDPFLLAHFARHESPPDAEAFFAATMQRVHRARRRRLLTRAALVASVAALLLAALFGLAPANSAAIAHEVAASSIAVAAFGQLLALPWVWLVAVLALLSGRALAHAGRGC